MPSGSSDGHEQPSPGLPYHQHWIVAVPPCEVGNAFFSPSVSKRLLDQCREAFVRGGPVRRRSTRLTTREAEVLQLIAEGQANKQIAAELNISIKTVEKHRQQVMNKLNIHDVAGLTRHAIAKGIIETTVRLPTATASASA